MSNNKDMGFELQDVSQLTYQSDSGTSFIIVTESGLPNTIGAEYLNFSGMFPRESSVSQGYESQVSSIAHENTDNSKNSFSTEYIVGAGSQEYSQETFLPIVDCSNIENRPLTFTGLFQRACSGEDAIEESGTSTLNDESIFEPKSRMKRKPLAEKNGRSALRKPVKRPGQSYSQLIMDVLLEGERMTVREICKTISDKYPKHFNMEEERWKVCVRNCLTQKDQFIRETSKLKGNYWKLSNDLLRKLRPPDDSSQSGSPETSSVWNSGKYVTIAPKRAYYSDGSLDGVIAQGGSYVADVSGDRHRTPLKSSVIGNNRQCFSGDRNFQKSNKNVRGEINRTMGNSKSCYSLGGVVTPGGSYIIDTSTESYNTPSKSSVIGNNRQCFSEDRNLFTAAGERMSISCHSFDGVVTQRGSYVADAASSESYNTPSKSSVIGNNRQCFSEDRNLLKSNLSVNGERNKTTDSSKSCSQANLKRGSEIFHDENRTPVSRKRSRFARHTVPKIKPMQGFKERLLDAEKKLTQRGERLAGRNIPGQFSGVCENVESSSEESRGFKISSVSRKKIGARNEKQFAASSHQLKDLTNFMRNPSTMEKGRRDGSVIRNGEKIETQNKESFLFKTIGEVQSFDKFVGSNGDSVGRSFSTSHLNSGDVHNRLKKCGETSTLVRLISLPGDDGSSVKDLNEIPETTSEATTRDTLAEITSAETSTAVRSISLDYDDRNSGVELNGFSDDGKDETAGGVTTAETLNTIGSTIPHSDDRNSGEDLDEFSDDGIDETTSEIMNVKSPNSDDVGREEVFAAYALPNETYSPPELGDTLDNIDFSSLDNFDAHD